MIPKEKKDKLELLDIILQDRAILFAKYLSDNCYEHRFKGSKGWITYFDEQDDESKMKRFTIKELYKKFMIDYLCS